MKTIKETKNYEFAYDELYGVGRFIRKLDGKVGLMFTGHTAAEIKDRVKNSDEELERMAKLEHYY